MDLVPSVATFRYDAHMKHHTSYLDTRGLDHSLPAFSRAVLNGIASGGGLYVPETMPQMSLAEITALSSRPYWQRAAVVFSLFGIDMDASVIEELAQQAYGAQWANSRIAPVVEVQPGTHVLELWHGPTGAFKDMALQCMPLLFSKSIQLSRERGETAENYLILVATSGDTGKAALEGFANRDHTWIAVFYPAEGVSDIQRKQMVTQHGSNVCVLGVHGNFDDCQNTVKELFGDEHFSSLLLDNHNLRLSSANSINWGRLMPQIAYYVSAYSDMVASGGVKAGMPIDVCVPTGNFGNILAAYYAKLMGVPIDRLICASNENNVLSDFIETGIYDISQRNFVKTPSPSMDILISSNLERLLYHLAGAEKVARWMDELSSAKRFEVDRATFAAIHQTFASGWVDNDTALSTIKRVFEAHKYLIDPHTAVAWEVAERMRSDNPVLVVSTAAWAKFGDDVLKALLEVPYEGSLTGRYRGLSGFETLAAVKSIAGRGAEVPAFLKDLGTAEERFPETIPAERASVERALTSWLKEQ